jgi:hypothetical protein
VVLAVACQSYSQMAAVRNAINRKGVPELHGPRSYRWFGGGSGDFDHLFTIINLGPPPSDMIIGQAAGEVASRGDNRLAWIGRAGPLLRDIGRLP